MSLRILRTLARRAYINGSVLAGRDERRLAALAKSPFAGRTVRVLLAHATPDACADNFRRQLDYLAKNFELITFETFKALASDPGKTLSRPGALLTFDDGFESNYSVGAKMLEDVGARGVFFVVPGFVLSPRERSAAFVSERLRADPSVDSVAAGPAQLKELADRGHTIGNHTHSHPRLSETPTDQLAHEILDSAAIIESWTGRPCEAFAWTFTWNAITKPAYDVIRARFPYIFSPCPGLVRAGPQTPGLIWRTNLEASADLSTCRFMASGLGDPVWAARRDELAAMLNHTTA